MFIMQKKWIDTYYLCTMWHFIHAFILSFIHFSFFHAFIHTYMYTYINIYTCVCVMQSNVV